MRPKFHQFHSGVARGDAVTNSMLFLQGLLKKMGYGGEIYAAHIGSGLDGQLHHFSKYEEEAGDFLIIHHSMGHDQEDWLMGIRARKILIYHNITPAIYFESEYHKRYIDKGLEFLNTLRDCVEFALCPSDFNNSELLKRGFCRVSKAPLLISKQQIFATSVDPWLSQKLERYQGIKLLYVSRISSHKNHKSLIPLVKKLYEDGFNPKMFCVGDYTLYDSVYSELMSEICSSGLESAFCFPGKVTERELRSYYENSDFFLCPSNHEGFGVPLIEAMMHGLPVIANHTGAIPETLGRGGYTLPGFFAEAVIGQIKELKLGGASWIAMKKAQKERVEEFDEERITESLSAIFNKFLGSDFEPQWGKSAHLRYEGPLESNYSLAKVNRNIALSLSRLNGFDVSAFPIEGPGLYPVEFSLIYRNRKLLELYKRGFVGLNGAGILIRNLYPPIPRKNGKGGQFFYFAWEESRIPSNYIDDFNLHVDAIFAASKFVKKVLQDSGFKKPVIVVGSGVREKDLLPDVTRRIGEDRPFTFLSVSSAFPRKGIQELIDAFFAEFKAEEAVRLIIKAFPNPHNEIGEYLRDRYGNDGRVEFINKEISTDELDSLYKQSDVFVSPSKGEGFGLSVAEAYLHGIPVVGVQYSGTDDFLTEGCFWPVDFRFEYARSHTSCNQSLWVEPLKESLRNGLRVSYDSSEEKRLEMAQEGKRILLESFRWGEVSEKIHRFLQVRGHRLGAGRLRIGWVTTWERRCGIAEYSRKMIEGILGHRSADIFILAEKRSEFSWNTAISGVTRCWDENFLNTDLQVFRQSIQEANLQFLVVQFNLGFFHIPTLNRVLLEIIAEGVKVIFFFHALYDFDKLGYSARVADLSAMLKKAERVVLFNLDDLNKLKDIGIWRNTMLMSEGIPTYKNIPLTRAGGRKKFLVKTFGYLLPHKGVLEVIEALGKLVNEGKEVEAELVNSIYPGVESEQYKALCQSRIRSMGLEGIVRMTTDYLSVDEIGEKLGEADLIVYAYQFTSESNSGAIRMGLGAGKPILCTPVGIFQNFREIVEFARSCSPEDIAASILEIMENPIKQDILRQRISRLGEEESWDKICGRFIGMLESISVSD